MNVQVAGVDGFVLRIIFEIILGLLNIGIVFALTSMRSALIELRDADRRSAEKITSIEVLVAANYLTREEFSSAMRTQTDTILRAVDRQQAQIDGKMDKPHASY